MIFDREGAMEEECIIDDPQRAVFICYSHKDNDSQIPKERWLDRFLAFVRPLTRQEKLNVWSDKQIKTGDNWHVTIQSQLNKANAVVLLVSPNFLESDYIANNELPMLLKNADEKGIPILQLIISPCLYEDTKFKYPDPKVGPYEFSLASIQAANPPSKTLIEMNEGEQNRVLLEIAKRLADVLRHESGDAKG